MCDVRCAEHSPVSRSDEIRECEWGIKNFKARIKILKAKSRLSKEDKDTLTWCEARLVEEKKHLKRL